MRRGLVLALAAILWAATVRAEEPATDAAPAGEAHAAHTGTGDGGPAAGTITAGGPGADAVVTLPLAEFEALMSAGEGRARHSGPPLGWAVREADYDCTAVDERGAPPVVKVAARLKLEVLAEGYQAVPVGGAGVVFTSALLDGKDVLLVAAETGDRSAVLVQSRGPHLLEIAFTVPLPGDGAGSHRLTFGIARSPVSRVNLLLDQPPARLVATGAVVAGNAKKGAKTEVHLLCPPSEQVAVSWVDPAPAPTPSASPASAALPPRVEAQMTSRYAFRADRVTVEAQALLSVRQGSIPEVRVNIPAGLRLLRIREQNGETTPRFTSIHQPNGATLVAIHPLDPLTGDKRYRLELEQLYPDELRPPPDASAAPIQGPTPPPPSSPLPPAPPTATSTSTPSSAPTTSTTPPSFGPPLALKLSFLTFANLDSATGEFTLNSPASPLTLETPEPHEPMKRLLTLSSGITSGPTFSYTGSPEFTVTLRLGRVTTQPPCSVQELRGRTIVLPEGGLVSHANWLVVNRREPTLDVALPPGAEVLTAFLDGDPVRLGLRNAAGPSVTSRPGVRVDFQPPGDAPPGGMSSAGNSNASSAPVGTTAQSSTAVPRTEPATVPWVELAVPLRQDPDRLAHLEITYREPGPVLSSRDHLRLRLPRIAPEITTLRWDLDVPAGYQPRATADGLKPGDPVELRGQSASPLTTGAHDPSPLTSAAAALAFAPPHFELPEAASGTRITLAGDGVKANAAPEVELTTVSLGLQQVARTLVFLLTLAMLADLFWLGLGTTFTVGTGVALAGTVLVSLVLGLSVMLHVVAGVVAALTFKLIRVMMDPVEEKEAS